MIEYHFKSDFEILNRAKYSDWITRIIESEGFVLGQVDYVFCTDEYLLGINQQYLDHDTLTDIITFDYCDGKTISGDIFISTERVNENAETYNVDVTEEMLRVMSHGVLHLIGYADKSDNDTITMREKESQMIKLFHVEH